MSFEIYKKPTASWVRYLHVPYVSFSLVESEEKHCFQSVPKFLFLSQVLKKRFFSFFSVANEPRCCWLCAAEVNICLSLLEPKKASNDLLSLSKEEKKKTSKNISNPTNQRHFRETLYVTGWKPEFNPKT